MLCAKFAHIASGISLCPSAKYSSHPCLKMPREEPYESAAVAICLSTVAALGFVIFAFTSDCIWCYPVAALFFLPFLGTICYCCWYNECRGRESSCSEPCCLPEEKCCICEWCFACEEDCCARCNAKTSCLCLCQPKPAPKPKTESKPKQPSPTPQEAEALPTPPPVVLKEVVVSA